MRIEVRTAGMAHGTPDWQLDRMYETETAAVLEKHMNSAEDFPRADIASDMSSADYHIGQAIIFLARAANTADPFGKAEPIDELLQRLEDYRIDMKEYRETLGGAKQ